VLHLSEVCEWRTLRDVAAGLRPLVRTAPEAVAKMIGAPAEGTCAVHHRKGCECRAYALVDRLAGVMAVNSLSAEAVLARFFDQDLLSSHLFRLEKSGRGNAATLAARIVAQWKPEPPGGGGKKNTLGSKRCRQWGSKRCHQWRPYSAAPQRGINASLHLHQTRRRNHPPRTCRVTS
jgi:hypothetical protein